MAFEMLARFNLAGGLVTAVVSIVLATINYSFMAPISGYDRRQCHYTCSSYTIQRPNFRIFYPSVVGHWDVIRFGAYSPSSVAVINVFYKIRATINPRTHIFTLPQSDFIAAH